MSHMQRPIECYDIAIVGGGMVGASLALALKNLPIKIAMIEAIGPDQTNQPSFDARTLALSNATQRVFETLQVWHEWQAEAISVKRIHISEQGRFGSALVDAAELGLKQLGFIVPAQSLGRVLVPKINQSAVQIFSPATVVSFAQVSGGARVELSTPQGSLELKARLIVAADGAQSTLRQAAQLTTAQRSYGQTAVIAPLRVSELVLETAFERFTKDGPIAMLPRPGGVVAIWAMPTLQAEKLLALDDERFLAALQAAFGWRLGRLQGVGERIRYELGLSVAEQTHSERLVLIGNSAQSLHPIAGQGFNLGLRDAMTLVDVIADGLNKNLTLDLGDDGLLKRFAAYRSVDRERVIGFTDRLVRGFGVQWPLAGHLRSRALSLFDFSLTAKRALSAIASGGNAYQPRLARGLSVS